MTPDRGTVRRRVAGTGLASSRTRFERRAAAARRRPRLVAAILVAVLLVAGFLAWLGWFSSVLTASKVEVVGVKGASAAQVRSIAKVPLGGPLMRVDTDEVTQRIVDGRAWSAVSVSRSLPDTVVIEVTPRVAVLAVRNPQGQVDVVDRDGFAFRTVDAAPDGVPLVSSGAAQVTKAGVTAAVQALRSLDPALRADVSGVSVSAADQVSFTVTAKGERSKTVVWGGAGDGERKAQLVKILLREPGSTIDVSVPASPVTR
ncbi:cell division protein FtsQ/DivIB [Terrabacter sp. GCM10028922]|jgi:cell division protein FtsQ|uniref:cell division protein FtsQ/DivIB n=1 Tax=Terrabacter sp. GCM10028922 TaxID=3273428 RepID=UPI00361A401E